MNQHDLLKAIGEVSEDAVQKYALPKSRNSDAAPDDDEKDIVMEKNEKRRIHFSRAGIAAAVALVLGLNAAIIYAVHRMKQDVTTVTPGASIEQEIEEQTVSANEEIDEKDRRVFLPDVKDWDFETAKQTILGLNLYVDKRNAFSDTVPAGRVIATDPEGPAELKPESYVRVTVSLGPNIPTPPVPNFVGMTFEDAKIAADGIGIVLELAEGSEKELPIIYQNVKAGTEVQNGEVVTVATDPDAKSQKSFLNLTFTIPDGVTGVYRVRMENENGETEAISSNVDAEKSPCINLIFSGEGTVEYKAILVNDKTGAESTIGSYLVYFDGKPDAGSDAQPEIETVTDSDIIRAFEEVGTKADVPDPQTDEDSAEQQTDEESSEPQT